MDIQFTKEVYNSPQVSTPAPRRRWDRWLYLFILIVLLSSFFKWLIYPYLFDLSDGVLLKDQYDINFAQDIRINEYFVKDGDLVEVGDTLFSYEGQDNLNIAFQNDSIIIQAGLLKETSTLIEIQAQIDKRILLIQEHRKRLAYWKSERERKQQLVYLNVITNNELANVDRSIDDVEIQIASLKVETLVLKKQLQDLQKIIHDRQDLEIINMYKQHENSYFVSPVAGRIDRLRGALYQITYEKEVIASILQPNYFVRAYIDMNRFEDFKIGDLVTITLPYRNQNIKGVVSKIYMVSEDKDIALLEESYKDRKGIVMEIIPDDTEADKWAELEVSNIPVKIRKFKMKI